MNGQARAALITAGTTLLAALIAAAISMATLVVSQRTRREVERQAREQAEHEVVFEGIYTRRADAAAELYRLIATLDRVFPRWISLEEGIARRIELLSHPGAPNEEERDKHERGISEQEQQIHKLYFMIQTQQQNLRRFYEGNHIWFTETTCEKIDALMDLQEKFLESIDPGERLIAERSLQELDTLWTQTRAKVNAIIEDANETLRQVDSASEPIALVEEEQEDIAQQASDWWRENKEHYLPALKAARKSIEKEFRDVLRIA